MRFIFVLITILLAWQVHGLAQEKGAASPEELADMLNEYRSYHGLEKAYLHTDKPYYSLGESIWFTAYLRDEATLLASDISKSLHVDLIDPDGKIIHSLNLFMDSIHCHGNFELGMDGLAGTYRLRAYTSWMRNYGSSYFFEKKLRVFPLALQEKTNVSLSDVSSSAELLKEKQDRHLALQFFPEGGSSVLGIKSRVGVKLSLPEGKGMPFEAILYDSLGLELLQFEGNQLGMGSFWYKPTFLSGYYVLVKNLAEDEEQNRFLLPASMPKGVSLSVNNVGDKEAKVKISFSNPSLNKGGKLMIASHNESLGIVPIRPNQGRLQFSIPLANVRDGTMRFTLFDEKNYPLAERIIFVYSNPTLRMGLNKSSFNSREKVELELHLESAGASGKASLTVFDSKLVDPGARPYNIVSELLLDKEIKGQIISPAWYFRNYDDEKRMGLDDLMLCQGWRKYHWMQKIREFPTALRYVPEKGITISGATSKLWKEEKTLKTQVTMVSTKGPFQYGEVITTDSGRFTFTGMVFFDSVSLVFQAHKYNVKRKKVTENRNVTLKLFEQSPPSVKALEIGQPERSKTQLGTEFEAFLKERKLMEQIKRAFDPVSYTLDTVAITANSSDPLETYGAASSELLYRLDLDSIPGALAGSVWDYLITDPETKRIVAGFASDPSAVLIDVEGNQSIEDFNNFLPVWLDGVQLTEQDAMATPISFIGTIEILLSADVAITQGTENGVVMLYSRSGGGLANQVVRGINGLKHPGFSVGKEFFKPLYPIDEELAKRPDRRLTLHWEPIIRFGADGKASLSFFTDDKKSTYTIQLEGVTDDGRPFFKSINFTSE